MEIIKKTYVSILNNFKYSFSTISFANTLLLPNTILEVLIKSNLAFLSVKNSGLKTKFISADKDPESVSKEKTKNNKPSLEEVKQ